MSQEKTLDISWEAIVKVFIAIFIFYFIYLARDIMLWVIFGVAISVILEPAINVLRKVKIPKLLAILMVYFSIFGILGLLIYLVSPIFISEIKQLSTYLPDYVKQMSPFLEKIGFDAKNTFDSFTGLFISGLEQSSRGVMNALIAFFGGVASALFILAISFFLSLEERGLEKFLMLITPKRYEEKIITFFEMAQGKVAGWFGARVLACLFVGVASFVVFYMFGIQYALILALIAGVLNFVPYIGPWFTAIILSVFVFASSSSWITVGYVLLAFLIIQQIENSLLTPLLMKKFIDIPPVLVLVSLLVGAKVFGFLGAIFAVPVFGIIYEFIKEFLESRRDGSLLQNEE